MFSILCGLFSGIAYSCLVTFIVLFTSSIYSESFKSEQLNFPSLDSLASFKLAKGHCHFDYRMICTVAWFYMAIIYIV